MRLILFASVLLFCFHFVFAGNCYHCMTGDQGLEPTTRRHLKTQSDVFFWQIGMHWDACSRTVDPNNPSIEAQICSKYDLCVTLQPNVNGSSFVIRGCLENVLRHTWREDPRMHSEGCYLIRSMPMYPNRQHIDYIICVCKDNYCNKEHAVSYLPGEFELARDSVIQLEPVDEKIGLNQPMRLTVSSATGVICFTSMLFITLGLY